MDKFWLPLGELFANRDEVGAGCAESDSGADLVGKVFQPDDVIDCGDGGEAFGKVGSFGWKVGFNEPQGTNGEGLFEEYFPVIPKFLGCEKFCTVSAGIDDGDSVGEVEILVFGYREESEQGFVFSRKDLDGGVLTFCLIEKILGVGGDSEGHGSGGSDGVGGAAFGLRECGSEGGEGFVGAVRLDETGSFRATAEPGDGGSFVDNLPSVGGVIGDGEEDGV